METAEYAAMAGVESRHWWYCGLRAVIRDAWGRSVHSVNPKLLDVGCGTGANLMELRGSARPIGIDVAHTAIGYCRSRGLEGTAVASADALPFASAYFDVALSCDVLSHRSLPNKCTALMEIRRVLRPGGVLLINVPAYQWLLSTHDRAVHQDRRFTCPEIKNLLREAGFITEWISHWNAVLLPAAVVVRWLRCLTRRQESDLIIGSGEAANGLLRAVIAAERSVLRRARIPFGLSIFAIARRPERR